MKGVFKMFLVSVFAKNKRAISQRKGSHTKKILPKLHVWLRFGINRVKV